MDRSDTLRKKQRIMRGTFIQAVLVCVLSCGILLTLVSSFLPGLAIAAPASNTTSNTVTKAQPTSVSKSSSPMKVSHSHKPANNQPNAALPVGPDLAMNLIANASSYGLGQVVTYTLSITNNSAATSILAGVPINVTDVFPIGLTSMAVTTLPGQWNLLLTSSTSPATMSATYTGSTPVTPGGALPPITIVGILTAGALGNFSNTASVSVPGDVNLTDNTMTLTIPVSPVAPPTATPTVVIPTVVPTVVIPTIAPTLTPTVAPTPTPTIVPTPTPTIVPTPTPTIVPTPTPTIVPTATATSIVPTATATSIVPTATATSIVPTATPTVAPTATSTPIVPPDLSITQSFGSVTPLQVGQSVTITLTINNSASAGPLPQGNSVLITDILPLGFNQISVGGNNWFSFVTSSTGPTLLSAIYTTPGAITSGGALPVLTITGTLDANILPGLANTASVSTSGDANVTNNVSIGVVSVIPALAPDLNILQTVLGDSGSTKVVGGQVVTMTLAITNLASSGPLAQANSISAYDVLPRGLSQIVATGNNWFVIVTSTTGPSLLTAVYSSSGPLLAGQPLPLLTIHGIVNANASGTTLTNIASVSAPGDGNTANNSTTTTFYVAASGTPTVAAPGTPTVPASGTSTVPTPVVSPSPSAFLSLRGKRV